MSAVIEAPIVLTEPIVQPRQTYIEFAATVLAHTNLSVEFINGDIYMTPAPVPAHQFTVRNLLRALDAYAVTQRLGEVLSSPLDIELAPERQIVQPDLIFISQDRVAALVGEKRITGAPDLLVEILSPATARLDRHVKLPLYAASGVAEYWIVDMAEQAVEVYTLDGATYRVAGIFLNGDIINVGRFAPAAIAVASLFAA